MKLTPWFPADVEPVRPGVYQADIGIGTAFYRRWTGQHWLPGDYTVEGAARTPENECTRVPVPWRGLAEDPAAQGGAA